MKKYKNYVKNRELRKDNPNIRKIKDGKPVKFWSESDTPRPVGAF